MITERLNEVRAALPEGVRLVAVSKFHPVEALREAYDAGQRIFGESRVQELQQKHAVLPADIEWHFIGHLQTNKVRQIVPYVSLIHAVDSFHLLAEISRQAEKQGRVVRCLLQLHVAQEETKFGFSPNECLDMLASGEWRGLAGVRIAGMMCMASNTDDEEQIEREFAAAHACFAEARRRFFADDACFCECSWGMSHDFPLAVRHGSTLVRVGTKIFGERVY